MIKKMLFACIALLSLTIHACKSTEDTATAEGVRPEKARGQTPPSIEDIFKMDVDGDGMLSKEEVKGPLATNFDQIDLDKNGLLSREEVEKAPKPERRQRPSRG